MGARCAEGVVGPATGVDGEVVAGACVEADEGEDVVGYVRAMRWDEGEDDHLGIEETWMILFRSKRDDQVVLWI